MKPVILLPPPETPGPIVRQSGVPTPGDGAPAEAIVGVWLPANPLGEGWDDFLQAADRVSDSGGMLACWSGTPAEGLFEADPRSWTGQGWRLLCERVDEVLRRLARGRRGGEARLVLRTHARHVLGDHRAARTFLEARAGDAVGLLLDPAGLITPSMAGLAEEHLTRCLEMLAGVPGVEGIVVGGLPVAGKDDLGSGAGPIPAREHPAGAALVARLAQGLMPGTPLVMTRDDAAALALAPPGGST